MTLYPEIPASITYELDVDYPHKIYVEECGNPQGIPVIFLHGGPGSGCNESHRRYFNPDKYRIVLFDQRGCGRSSPHGCLEKNTTHDLIADIETIRDKLNIEKYLVFAGSWGVSLALLYAQQHREHVLGLILRGSFLASKRDMDWFFSDGVSRIFPELWENFSTCLPKQHDEETLLQGYHHCLFCDDKALNEKATLAWIEWTDSIVTWNLQSTNEENQSDSPSGEVLDKLVRKVRLEVHYAINHYFLDENHLLNHMREIQDIPSIIIHGRRDITCPLESSWKIHNALADSELKILPDAGHLAGEQDMIEALVSATDEMSDRLEK